MATKTERFKAEVQRAAHAKRPPKPRQDSAGKRAKEKGRTKDRFPNPTSHNESPRSAKNSPYELEPSLTARPSRKSTRRSPTHIKTDSALRIAAMNRNASPQRRAGRSKRNPI